MQNSLVLMIGNSRLHWGWFQGDVLQKAWDSQHLSIPLVKGELPQSILPPQLINCPSDLPLYIASVVPSQTELWETYSLAKLITLEQIPLNKLYPTMGIDRALAVLGMGVTYGFPCLVIDAGTALTLTGVNDNRVLVGGAILPGLKLQFQSLAQKTAALPELNLPETLPNRWANTTPEAIESGIIYALLAGIKEFIRDWWQEFPNSLIALTGGDSNLLLNYLKMQNIILADQLIYDPHLIFWGMRSLYEL